MDIMNKSLFSTVLLIIFAICSCTEAPIKIMPVGDSITAGEHYGYPKLELRTGYRKALFEMLIHSGYNIDFVGSQSHGIRTEEDVDWYDWNCEAFPGWTIPDITRILNISLRIYEPEILLVHVGTNGDDWEDKPDQVMQMLDMINDFSVVNNHSVTIFLCSIINRYKGNHIETTHFNCDVRKMLDRREDDKIKVILLDMENGIGLDYSDTKADLSVAPPYEGGDMFGETYPGVIIDLFHPNEKGNTKMAIKFYQELIKVL